MGSCCTRALWDDNGESTVAADEPQPEFIGRRVGAEDTPNFRMYDQITLGKPPWVVLPLPTTWPPFTAGYAYRFWKESLPVTL